MGSDRVFDGEIRMGLRRYFIQERKHGETVIGTVQKQTRKHTFGEGYSDSGRARKLTQDLTVSDARAVRDLLDDWLEERDNE